MSPLMRLSLAVFALLLSCANGRQKKFPQFPQAGAGGYASYSAGGAGPYDSMGGAVSLAAGAEASPRPWASDLPADLQASVARTSKVASFLAQDVQALSEELRGLETVLRHRGGAPGADAGVRQRQRAGALDGAGLQSVPAGDAWPQEPQPLPRQPWQSLEAPAAPAPAPVGGMLAQPALSEQGMPYEADPEVVPTLSALQTSVGTMDDMLEQAEVSQDVGAAPLGVGQAPTQLSELRAPAQLPELRAQAAAADFGAAPAPAPVPELRAPAQAAELRAQADAAGMPLPLMLQNTTNSSAEGASRCGGPNQVQCSDFMKFYTLGYHFDVFWSTVHWTLVFLMLCMCCCCCRMCMFRRR